MTRYATTIDLRRCVGCQTCTAACKGANATPPGIQWRRVLDIETGEFPDVRRTFLPMACMHCANPPCEEVCPTKATTKRADGLVAIDYHLCMTRSIPMATGRCRRRLRASIRHASRFR